MLNGSSAMQILCKSLAYENNTLLTAVFCVSPCLLCQPICLQVSTQLLTINVKFDVPTTYCTAQINWPKRQLCQEMSRDVKDVSSILWLSCPSGCDVFFFGPPQCVPRVAASEPKPLSSKWPTFWLQPGWWRCCGRGTCTDRLKFRMLQSTRRGTEYYMSSHILQLACASCLTHIQTQNMFIHKGQFTSANKHVWSTEVANMLIKKAGFKQQVAKCRAALHLLGDDDVLDESKFERTDWPNEICKLKKCEPLAIRTLCVMKPKNHQKSMNKNANNPRHRHRCQRHYSIDMYWSLEKNVRNIVHTGAIHS